MTQAGFDRGRPTQFHNVPEEERAFDSKGKRLPWALVWPDGHANARGQKRFVDEKGPFGKSSRRQGSSRTRTTTPGKKENPTLEGFERALHYDLQRNANDQPDTVASTTQSDNKLPSHQTLSVTKEPIQVTLFGYSTITQWAALAFFESVSLGMICEDYERQPPSELRKYPNTYSASPRVHTRPLTKAEKSMAFKYDGGNNWVKVTFDSAEAAERAIEHSPAQICGHWVYAQLYHGSGPEHDEAILIREGEREAGRPLHNKAQTIGASFVPRTNSQQRGTSTLGRSFFVNAAAGTDEQQFDRESPSSTNTSGTAKDANYPDLRHRNQYHADADWPAQQAQQPHDPQMMRHFPNIPRTAVRPAHEAFLPVPTWWELQMRWLADKGSFSGEVIGNGIPLTEYGEFDWKRASFYWKIFYWIDTHFDTDYCGLKDNE